MSADLIGSLLQNSEVHIETFRIKNIVPIGITTEVGSDDKSVHGWGGPWRAIYFSSFNFARGIVYSSLQPPEFATFTPSATSDGSSSRFNDYWGPNKGFFVRGINSDLRVWVSFTKKRTPTISARIRLKIPQDIFRGTKLFGSVALGAQSTNQPYISNSRSTGQNFYLSDIGSNIFFDLSVSGRIPIGSKLFFEMRARRW